MQSQSASLFVWKTSRLDFLPTDDVFFRPDQKVTLSRPAHTRCKVSQGIFKLPLLLATEFVNFHFKQSILSQVFGHFLLVFAQLLL